MKRTSVASLCIGVLLARHAANAQENECGRQAVRTGLDCNHQQSKLCQLFVPAQPVVNVDVQSGSRGGSDPCVVDAIEPQKSTEVTKTDSQVPPGLPRASAPAKEAAAILELGAEPARSLSGGGWSLSPTVAVEVTPIEKWLELEIGITPTFSHHSTEWDTDVLFKKPWVLSKKVEFMFGVGPVWSHTRKNGITTNSVSGEIALDFMFWPSPTRRLGWYVEPAYDYSFGGSHDQAIGVSIGLLISVR